MEGATNESSTAGLAYSQGGRSKKKGLVTACNFCIKYLSSTKLETIIHKYIKFRHKIIKYFFKSK